MNEVIVGWTCSLVGEDIM